MAAKFSGHFSEDDWANVTFTTAMTAYPFTTVFWIWQPTSGGAGEAVAYRYYGTDGFERWSVDVVANDFTSKENGGVGVHMQRNGSGGGASYVPNYIMNMRFEELQQVVVVTSAAGTITHYVNGVESTASESAQFRDIFNAGNTVTGMIIANSATSGATHRTNAYISELAVYESALTLDQIKLLQTNRPNAIGVTPKHYWPLYNSFADLGSDGDDLVYNVASSRAWGGADNYFEPDPQYHPSLVGSATIDTLTETPVILDGTTYTSGGAPYSNVPDTHASVIEDNGWGTVTYNDDDSGNVVKMSSNYSAGGQSLTSGSTYWLPKATAAKINRRGYGSICPSHPYSDQQYAKFNGGQGKSVENTSASFGGPVVHFGGWILMTPQNEFDTFREHFQLFNISGNFRVAGKILWGSYPGTFTMGAERHTAGNYIAVSDDIHENWERWIHVHHAVNSSTDVQTWINGVEDTEGSQSGTDIFGAGNLTEIYLGGKKPSVNENATELGMAHWYLYDNVTPSDSVIVELSKFLPDTVTTQPDHYWPLNGDLNDAIGSLNLADVAGSSFTWQAGGPKIGSKI